LVVKQFAVITLLCAQLYWCPPIFAQGPQDRGSEIMRPADQYAAVIRPAEGETREAAGVVSRDTVVISFPYAYRRTAALQQAVTGSSVSILGAGVPAGAPGFFVGSFAAGRRGGGPVSSGVNVGDAWRFLPKAVGGRKDVVCFLIQDHEFAWILPVSEGYLINNVVSPNASARRPVFEEKSVTLPFDQRLEYAFVRWNGRAAIVAESAGGHRVRQLTVRPDADGKCRFEVFGRAIVLSRSGDSNREALVVVRPVDTGPVRPATPPG
jgi:hypothetical protein